MKTRNAALQLVTMRQIANVWRASIPPLTCGERDSLALRVRTACIRDLAQYAVGHGNQSRAFPRRTRNREQPTEAEEAEGTQACAYGQCGDTRSRRRGQSAT